MTLDRPNHLERYPVMDGDEMEPNCNILIIPEKVEPELTDKQLLDYHEYRKNFLTWLFRSGKDPSTPNGYPAYAVRNTAH